MTDAPQIRRFLVRGRVQGVGFRWFVEREASRLGLAGWVRNNPDSTVEVLASGTSANLAALQASLQQGPRAARVDAVEDVEFGTASDLQSAPADGRKAFRVTG